MAVPLTAATESCGGSCNKKACFAPGVYLYLGLQPDVSTAEICIDGACKTVQVEDRNDVTTTGPDQKYSLQVNDILPLPAGKKVEIAITLLDRSGSAIAKLAENRTMPNGRDECNCASLTYSWHDDGLHFG